MEGQKKGFLICGLVAGQPGAAKMVAIALNARCAFKCVWMVFNLISYCICYNRLENI